MQNAWVKRTGNGVAKTILQYQVSSGRWIEGALERGFKYENIDCIGAIETRITQLTTASWRSGSAPGS